MSKEVKQATEATVKPLSIRERRFIEATATCANMTEAASMAGYKGNPQAAPDSLRSASTSVAPRVRKRERVNTAMSEVHAASMREAVLTSANIKRRLWLLSHDAEAMGQFAPAVSAVVALHRDVERQADTHVTVQVIRIGGKDIYF